MIQSVFIEVRYVKLDHMIQSDQLTPGSRM